MGGVKRVTPTIFFVTQGVRSGWKCTSMQYGWSFIERGEVTSYVFIIMCNIGVGVWSPGPSYPFYFIIVARWGIAMSLI